ncbi:MAG: hypothetical protein ACR2QS_16240 [Woeseiaceae bacterium]
MKTTTEIKTRLIVALLLCAGLQACGDPPSAPEEAIRQWVADGQRLTEEKDKNGLVDMISPAYSDARGNERDDIENMFRIYFLRAYSVELLIKIDEIRVFGDTAAELDLTVGIAATSDGVMGFNADAYNFELELILDGDDWVLISGRWGEVGREIH